MSPITKLALAVVAIVCALAGAFLVAPDGKSVSLIFEMLSLAPLAMSLGMNIRDASLKATLALPNAASTTVAQAAGFDLEVTAAADLVAAFEILLTAPALTTVQLPNAATMTYNLIASASANLSTPTIIQQNLLVQTGAGGVCAALALARARIPVNLGALGFRYVGLQIVSGSTATNSSAVSATLEMLF